MENAINQWSRRKFVRTVSGVGGAIFLNPVSSLAAYRTDPKIAAIVASTIGIDTHNHIDVPLNTEELPGPGVDLFGEMKKSGLSAICMTFAVDYQKLNNAGEAYNRFLNGLTAMDKILERNNITRSLNLSDIQAAHKAKQPTVIQSVEGGHFLEGQLNRLEVAYKRGLRHVGLLHDNDASVPLGDVFTNPPKWGGLTTFGADVIKECERLGILVDLAHCDDNTLNAALKAAAKPVLISHTGLNTRLGQKEFMAKMMMPRLISKEQAKIVAEAGGVIGVWTHLAETPAEFAENVKALADVAGVEHVAIGTDTKMTPTYRSPNDQGSKPGGDGKNNGGEKKQNNGGEGTNRNWQGHEEGFYYTIVESLLNAGFNEEEIGKIGGGNYCRIFGEATKGH